MADLKDEFGNPIQLTDEHGNPVQLTDEHGNPVKLTGIATTETTTHETKTATFEPEEPPRGALDTVGIETAEAAVRAVTEVHGRTEKAEIVGACGEGRELKQQQELKEQGTERSTSTSSSGTSEEDEHGVRTKKKKKKGLTQKIKEKLTGGKHKEKEEQHPQTTTEVSVGSTTITTTTIGHGHHNEHEKKSVMEKIKEKLPGHHSQ